MQKNNHHNKKIIQLQLSAIALCCETAQTHEFHEPSAKFTPPKSICSSADELALLMLLEIASSPEIALHTQQHHFLTVNLRAKGGRDMGGSPSGRKI